MIKERVDKLNIKELWVNLKLVNVGIIDGVDLYIV